MSRPDRETDDPINRNLFRMVAAPSVWALHFLLCYATTALACAKGFDFTMTRAAILGYTLVALAVIAWLGVASFRQWDYLDDQDYLHAGGTDEDRREFLGHVATFLSGLGFVAVIFTALPVYFIGSCA